MEHMISVLTWLQPFFVCMASNGSNNYLATPPKSVGIMLHMFERLHRPLQLFYMAAEQCLHIPAMSLEYIAGSQAQAGHSEHEFAAPKTKLTIIMCCGGIHMELTHQPWRIFWDWQRSDSMPLRHVDEKRWCQACGTVL